ncbi:decaprenyl-phosphate phosphoribosyltransferase [bacterium]|nr:decaprenyl-phosphate phosphoribosyltransferase [bacterium]
MEESRLRRIPTHPLAQYSQEFIKRGEPLIKRIQNTLLALVEIGRPKQWVKNGFIFAALIFDKQITDPESVLRVFIAFFLFCFYSSCVYMINDITDLERDRLHPEKRFRPLPAGRITVPQVIRGCSLLFLFSACISAFLSWNFFWVAMIYVGINILYSFYLKSVAIIDGMIIAFGFVIRTYAGAVVIGAQFSDWLYICATFVSLFLAFCKRRHEIILLGEENAKNHRAILREYTTQMLDQIIAIVTAATAVTYSLYCIEATNPDAQQHPYIKFTIPFVLYGLFRYLYLVYRKEEGGNPTEILLTDRPLLINGVLWFLMVLLALYFS